MSSGSRSPCLLCRPWACRADATARRGPGARPVPLTGRGTGARRPGGGGITSRANAPGCVLSRRSEPRGSEAAVARVAEGRAAAEPTSAEQRARYLRILEVAAELASDKGLERSRCTRSPRAPGRHRDALPVLPLQDAPVRRRDGRPDGAPVGAAGQAPRADLRPDEAAFAVLQKSTHALMRRPALAMAMISSSNAANAATVTDVGRIDRGFRKILLDAMGLEHPTAHDITLLRLLLQLWYGVLQSSLNGRISMPDAESDVRLACRLLLAGLSNAAPGSPPPAQD
ncbi:hypothetical protein [Streptomyces sp. SCUT-3]|uniref:hypothetical protein n=1 Tax=Streptomyces sp. SCUT-3 TaxID=2684469 RepID=UPI0021753C12|nr:hypothetical protein [Streptomyces sp. SCUT-3]